MLWCCVCASVCGQYMCVCDVSVMCVHVHVCGVYSCRLMLMSSAAFDNRCKSFNVYTYVCGLHYKPPLGQVSTHCLLSVIQGYLQFVMKTIFS